VIVQHSTVRTLIEKKQLYKINTQRGELPGEREERAESVETKVGPHRVLGRESGKGGGGTKATALVVRKKRGKILLSLTTQEKKLN